MPTTTTKLGLTKPDSGELNWATQMNGNLDLLDTFSGSPLGAPVVVTYSATPTFDLSLGTFYIITLTGAATPTFTNPRDGQLYTFAIQQDATGGRSFTFPNTFKGAGQISAATGNTPANGISVQSFRYSATLSCYLPVNAMLSF